MLFRRDKIKFHQNKEHEIDETGNKKWELRDFTHTKKYKERNRSHKNSRLLLTPMGRSVKNLSGKVSFCTFFHTVRKASLAVETAMVLPMFFLGIVTMISFMDIYKVQTEHFMKLCDRTKEAGMYAYALGGNGPGEVTLWDTYSYKPIGGLVPLPELRMYNRIKVHAWTGIEYEAFEDSQEPNEEMVYMSESGEVYHRNLGCSFLNLSVSQVGGGSIASARNAYGEKYAPCEICSRNQKPGGTVYITKKGNRYHNAANCRGLTRTIRMVKKSETKGVPACSRCGS